MNKVLNCLDRWKYPLAVDQNFWLFISWITLVIWYTIRGGKWYFYVCSLLLNGQSPESLQNIDANWKTLLYNSSNFYFCRYKCAPLLNILNFYVSMLLDLPWPENHITLNQYLSKLSSIGYQIQNLSHFLNPQNLLPFYLHMPNRD